MDSLALRENRLLEGFLIKLEKWKEILRLY